MLVLRRDIPDKCNIVTRWWVAGVEWCNRQTVKIITTFMEKHLYREADIHLREEKFYFPLWQTCGFITTLTTEQVKCILASSIKLTSTNSVTFALISSNIQTGFSSDTVSSDFKINRVGGSTFPTCQTRIASLVFGDCVSLIMLGDGTPHYAPFSITVFLTIP